MYLLKLALRPFHFAPMSQIFSAFAAGFLLLLVGFLLWMHQSLKPLVARLQNEQVVTVYLTTKSNEEDRKILNELKGWVQPSVQVKLILPSQFLSQMKGTYPDLAQELESLGNDAQQLIPHYVTLTGVVPDLVVEKIKGTPGVEQVENSKDRYRFIVGAFSTLRWIARLVVLAICVALLSGLVNLARMNGHLHRDALTVLKQWGAGSGLLAVPGILSGLLVGLMGGTAAFLTWIVFGGWLTLHVRSLSVFLKTLSQPHPQLALILLFLGILLGGLAGLIGSLGMSREIRGDVG